MKISNSELWDVHWALIEAQEGILDAYECVETDEFKLALVIYNDAMDTEFEDSTKNDDETLVTEEDWTRLLNIQRTYIRAQLDLLNKNNVYGNIS